MDGSMAGSRFRLKAVELPPTSDTSRRTAVGAAAMIIIATRPNRRTSRGRPLQQD
jgi:hypothetical protein